jgi:hypothetical protein
LIFGLLCCCLAIQRRYEASWSIFDESIWSLTSQRVKRISGSKNFRSSPQKDFFNTICQDRTCCRLLRYSRLRGLPASGRQRSCQGRVDFGTEPTFFTPTGALPGQPPFDEDIRQKIQVVKVGLNYKFDWGWPLAGRY